LKRLDIGVTPLPFELHSHLAERIDGGAVEHEPEMAAQDEAALLHQGTAYPGVDVHQGQDRPIVV
jgi:hypothetical protein